MINFYIISNESNETHSPNCNSILVIGSSGSGETNCLLNLINHQLDTDKRYFCTKDPY